MKFTTTEEVKGGSSGGSSSALDAAKDLVRAVEAKDAKAVDLALKRHYEACNASDDDDEEVSEDDESDERGGY